MSDGSEPASDSDSGSDDASEGDREVEVDCGGHSFGIQLAVPKDYQT